MLLRDTVNTIFLIIGAATLSDLEWATVDAALDSFAYDSDSYAALLAVLDSRELVSNTRDRLTYYYQARGVEITAPSSGTSNIFIGGSLCD